MNTNETDTSAVSGALGAVTQADSTAPRKSTAASRKHIEIPRILFDNTVTPELYQRLRPTGWKKRVTAI
jgi:hypothetical protein